MNLTKSFNKDFFWQMIKKSKGIVIFSIIIMPLLLSLYIILTAIDTNYSVVLHTNMTSLVTIGMYVFPFFYSLVFFGYVFKKKSIDFIGSMPINRKSIFITGTIGGIILMFLVHVILTVLIFFYGMIFRNLIVIPAAIIDGMILSFFAYVFVFSATNLAMSFSGTFMTQVLVTIIILFIAPITNIAVNQIGEANMEEDYSYEFEKYSKEYYSGYSYGSPYDTLIDYDGDEIYATRMDRVDEFTLPFNKIVHGDVFSYRIIIRMIVLSGIYSALGYYIFKRRNMENAEQSFGSTKMHLIIKAMTLYPFILMLNVADAEFGLGTSSIVTPLILFAVFYFIFDYIIKRKIPFKTTMVSYVVTLIILQIGVGTVRILYRPRVKEIDSDNIKAVSFGYMNENERWRSWYYSSYDYDNFDGEYFIEDEELIDLALNSMLNRKSHNFYDELYDDYNGYNYVKYDSAVINFKLKSGKVYSFTVSMPETKLKDIIDYYNDDDDYQEYIAKQIKKKGGVYLAYYGNRTMSKKETKIMDSIIEDIDTFDYRLNEDTVTKNVYVNHSLKRFRIPIRLLEEYEDWDYIRDRDFINHYYNDFY